MRLTLCLLAVLALGSILRAADPAPATAAVDLFNGKDLTGWSYVTPKASNISTVCTIKDGTLVVAGKPQGYLLLTGNHSGNYSVHFEYRWTSPNPKNNSGLLVNITGGPVQQNLWPKCFQIQTKTQRAGDIIPMGNATCAEIPAGKTQRDRQADMSEKAIGEWNACDTVVQGDTIQCTVNGVLQNHITKCVPATGQLGFQLEGYPYDLRNVRLTTLP
jgi:hypothetical protein